MTPDRDERLAMLIDELSEKLRAGEAPDVNALARQHADLGDELRSLWGAMLVADCVAKRADDIEAQDGDFNQATTPHLADAPAGDPLPPEGELWRLSVARRTGPRRHGRRLSRQADQPRPDRGAEDDSARRVWPAAADLARFRAEAAIGRAARPSGASCRCTKLASMTGQPYLHDEICRRHDAGRAAGRRADAGREAAALLAPVCRGDRTCPRAGACCIAI